MSTDILCPSCKLRAVPPTNRNESNSFADIHVLSIDNSNGVTVL